MKFEPMAEIAALHMIVLAMINIHPNKRALRDSFASISAQIRVGGIVSGATEQGLSAMQAPVDRFLSQLDDAIARENS